MWNLCMHDHWNKSWQKKDSRRMCLSSRLGKRARRGRQRRCWRMQCWKKVICRDCCILAVGGGVVTDLAGFVAGTYGRGVPFINYATSLLAAADASVGGKTAVDTPLATNLIGLINQPQKVYLDLDTWKTLPEREIYSGLAETIKHACRQMRNFLNIWKHIWRKFLHWSDCM